MERRIKTVSIFVIVSIIILALGWTPPSLACMAKTPYVKSSSLPEITQLKELCLNTKLSETVIVSPGIYDVQTLRTAIQNKLSSCEGPVTIEEYTDTNVPANILDTRTVIALGNMQTNAFILKLYREWYTLLDLKYPGGDGHVVRTLHNPHGTGHNVIFLGGSGNTGVENAVSRFNELLDEQGYCDNGSYIVPRLMDIALSPAYQKPIVGIDIGDNIPWSEWNVHSWRDSLRKLSDERTAGDNPATKFGWNPISISGLLYYMTGDVEYLQIFKKVARVPDSPSAVLGPLPEANKSNSNFDHNPFYDPENPLVDNYHYYTHLVDFVYDLIEESPNFNDYERMFITNRLLEHQDFLDPKHSEMVLLPNRHCAYDIMNIYSGSRYFEKYYPNVSWNGVTNVWEKRMDNVRASFDSFIGNPTWGETDTLQWVSTCTEVVFDFFMLDGFDKFVNDPATSYETAKTMMSIFDIMRNGYEADNPYVFNRYISINLLNKAAHMLNDDRYLWMLEELGEKTAIQNGNEIKWGFDYNRFRIGQSYWHPNANPPPSRPSFDMTNEVNSFTLADADWENANNGLPPNQQVPQESSFQVLSFRSGITKNDDFLQMDGFYGFGRNPYHLNSIYMLRMFGRPILWGYENDVDILFDGMSMLKSAQCAALKTWHYEESRNMLHVETEVPNMPESKWKRHVLCLKNDAAIIIDQITAETSGQFDITCSWSLWNFYNASFANFPDFAYKSAFNGVGCNMLLSHSHPSRINADESTYQVKQRTVVDLQAGEDFSVGNVFSMADSNSFKIRRVIGQDNAFLLSRNGIRHSLIAIGQFSAGGLEINADFAYCDGNSIFLFNDGMDVEKISSPANFSSILNGLNFQEPSIPEKEDIAVDWSPAWQRALNGDLAILNTTGKIWTAVNDATSSQIHNLNPLTGESITQISYGSPVLSLWPAANDSQVEKFDLLAGYKDEPIDPDDPEDSLIAYKNGSPVWNAKTKIHEDALRLNGPWLVQDIHGVHSILVDDIFVDDIDNNIEDIIAVGQASTVELRKLSDGSLLGRLPSLFGSNTSMGILQNVLGYGRMLVVGKRHTGRPTFTSIVENNGMYINTGRDLFYEIADDVTLSANEYGCFEPFEIQDKIHPENYTAMDGWQLNGVDQMVVSDIDNDGCEDVVFTLSGHWNELRVHRGDYVYYPNNTRPKWLHYFGSGETREDFMKGLSLIHQDDGTKAIATATRDGRLNIFDAFGKTLLAKQFDRDISCMVAVGADTSSPKIAVGFADGVVRLFAVRFENGEAFIFVNNDQNLSNAKLATGPVLMDYDRYNLYCGESNGTLTAFPLLDPNIGDTDGNGTVDLADAIAALKALCGINPSGVRTDYLSSGADVNQDGRVGMEEVLFVLQVVMIR